MYSFDKISFSHTGTLYTKPYPEAKYTLENVNKCGTKSGVID